MIQLEAVELLVRAARVAVGAGEFPLGTNRGPFVERCQAVTGNKPPDPWCASCVAMIGTDALKEQWPLPKTASCQTLYEFCEKKGAIVETPEYGDLFFIWHAEMKPAPRFAHVGIYVGKAWPTDRLTISGNTTSPKDANVEDPKASREGWCVAEKPWPFKSADRFARWARLLT